jgi:predicted nucleic-acid-binding Zn-ribbon protein
MSLFQKKEPEPAYVLGKPLTCGICGHARFWQREAQLHTGIATFFNLEWAEKSATCVVCENCGYIYWFLPPEEH